MASGTGQQPGGRLIRIVDFCAGLGGFHQGVHRAVQRAATEQKQVEGARVVRIDRQEIQQVALQ